MDLPNDINIYCKPFNELSTVELYEIMRLRQEVFIVEQNCPYLDCDGKDYHAWHLWATVKNEICGYTRLLPPGISYPHYASIGRVVTDSENRNTGLGYIIMQSSLQQMKLLFPHADIKISSQVYIMKFYEKLGFIKTGEPYLEDDIPHQAMILHFE